MEYKCQKCKDTGWYSYDHNHSKICEKCCPHDQGWWELTEGYCGYREGKDNRCCRAGCGMMYRDLKEEEFGYDDTKSSNLDGSNQT